MTPENPHSTGPFESQNDAELSKNSNPSPIGESDSPPPRRRRRKSSSQKLGGVTLVPLGGLGEIGRNMMAVEFGNDTIVIDAGVLFPDTNSPGIDLLLPDFSYLKEKSKNIRALVITHGHEDHIGAVPYLLKEIPGIPIYAPRMAMELIRGKLHEHRIRYETKKLHSIEKHKTYSLCPSFSVEFLEVNHSIRDSFGLALTTPIGMIVHTGDFKVEMDSLGSSEFDIHRFAEIGQKEVLLLCSDSTNVEKKQEERSEEEILRNIEQMSEMAKGRVLIATFASNVNRVARIVEMAEKQRKKVCLLGRNIENNFEIAQRLGYVEASKTTVVPYQSIKNYPDHRIIIISTGTQGETLSALTRISQDLHKIIKLKTSDTIIISASVIPGNEKPISLVLDRLATKTPHVYYSRNAAVHVSGHATQRDLLLMLRLVKPKFFMPVHGEKRFLIQHTHLAHRLGIPATHTLVAQNGDVIQLTKQSLKQIRHFPHRPGLVQGGVVADYRPLVEERLDLSKMGIIFVSILWDQKIPNDTFIQVYSRGFLLLEEQEECNALIEKHLRELLTQETEELSLSILETRCKKSLEFLLNSKYRKSSLVEVKIQPRNL